MPRKDSTKPPEKRGFNDVIGIILLSLAFLLLVALFSFDRADLRFYSLPPNQQVHNWIGPVGAAMANGCFLALGAAAYLVPILLLGLGLGFLLPSWSYFKQRGPWSLVLLLATSGLLDLYSVQVYERLATNLNPATSNGHLGGGSAGDALNRYLFLHFGWLGATTIFATLYLISLLCLTNFQLGDWLHWFWQRVRPAAPAPGDEKALEQRARELEKQARKLQEEVEKTGLGADLQPVPEPTVRDLSVPSSSPAPAPIRHADPPPKSAATEELTMDEEPEPERVVPAASTADILGKSTADTTAETKSHPDAENEAEPPGPATPAPQPDLAPPPPKPRPAPRKPRPLAVATPPVIGNYQLPPLDLLAYPDTTIKPTETKEDLMASARLMQNTLAQFDIEVTPGDITKGPTITRYELHPAPGVRLEKISALSNNLAAALKAENVNILAPIPGKSSVGVEVPNSIKTKVIIRDLMGADEWQKTKARIPLALGKDVYGHPMIVDLAEMPHLLIAGSTGSGKSVCINSIVSSLLYRFSPDQLRFVMIDPKVVELQQYNLLPHLVVPVVTDPKKVVLALRWVVTEMEKRYQIFARVGVRNIKSFNERPKNKPLPQRQPELPLQSKKERVEASSEGFAVELDEEMVLPEEEHIVIPDKLSYIVVIIDELADLMLVAPADVEMAIARITQMARAAGIHCIVATQRPSVDVITGVIKANIPARIAFQVASKVDSRTILDAMGADKLLGKGDMLYLPPGSSKLIRAQGALVTDQEIQSIVDFIAKQGKPSYELEIHQQLSLPGGGRGEESNCDEDEELIQQCIEVIRSEQKASVSLMQRRLRLGYTRAARIMDELENRGIVGPSKGAEPRDILIDLDAPDPETPAS